MVSAESDSVDPQEMSDLSLSPAKAGGRPPALALMRIREAEQNRVVISR